MAGKLIWGSDLYKGFRFEKNQLLGGGDITDILPFQQLSIEEKTIDWIKGVADFYDVVGWGNVERKSLKLQKNYAMRYGKLVQSDYIINPEINPFSGAIDMIVPPEHQSPLQQFYPIAPNFVDVLRGEMIKMDNTWTIEAIDAQSVSEKFKYKEDKFKEVVTQMVELQEQQTLAKMGLSPEVDPEQYEQAMQQAMQQFTEIELKAKNFRTTGQKWAEKVLKIHERRYNLHELEPDAFECGLITDSEFWHIDLLEDDFRIELLNPIYCDYHKGPNVKYVSDGDYFLWFDFMSTGDIINKYGRKLKDEDLEKLKDVYVKTVSLLVPDQLKNRQGAYYDLTKPYAEATDLNPVRNDAYLGRELAANYPKSGNFEHNINDVDLFSTGPQSPNNGAPQMFRVMRLYWRSFRKVGWLTKIERDGTVVPPQWIDENFRVTIEPVYDTSVTKEKTKDNLLYGEHIDWSWAPEWRHVMKISANRKHTFWATQENRYENIYIDGGPVKFQFKGRENPFDSLPPVEGCIFSHINTADHSFIDRIKSFQVLYNICMNKVPRKMLDDKGLKLAMDRRMMTRPDASNQATGMDYVDEYENKLDSSNIIDYTFTRETLEGAGQPGMPQVLNMSTVSDADFYLTLGDRIKWMAAESIGITRQRMGAQKASETKYGIEQGISYSETQTAKYFEQHANLMQRFRQRMLDAAQYYSTFHETSKEVYMNDRDENVFLNIEGMDNLLPHYNLHLQSRANVKAALQKISMYLQNDNTLPIKTSDKIEALVENSLPKIFTLIKEGEFELEKKEAEQYRAEMEQRQRELEAQQQMAAEKLAQEEEQAELDRQRDIDVATIRAMGGIQTDANADGSLDAKSNLETMFRQQEINDKRRQSQDAITAKRQSDTDKLIVEREKSQNDIIKEKIKQEGALKVAKENKQYPPKKK